MRHGVVLYHVVGPVGTWHQHVTVHPGALVQLAGV